jgi:hypothetical protein
MKEEETAIQRRERREEKNYLSVPLFLATASRIARLSIGSITSIRSILPIKTPPKLPRAASPGRTNSGDRHLRGRNSPAALEPVPFFTR